MESLDRTEYRAAAAAALMGLTLVVAACGSSGSNSTPSSAANTSTTKASTTSSTAPATGVVVGTTKGSLGTYLTGAAGRAVYIFLADGHDKSNCNGACASVWPPLITKAAPTASGTVVSADLGMITRADGSKQVTYKGHPLYYYVGDPSAGTTSGNGISQFGAKWWLISPAGAEVGA